VIVDPLDLQTVEQANPIDRALGLMVEALNLLDCAGESLASCHLSMAIETLAADALE
jgi:hypothetical protein